MIALFKARADFYRQADDLQHFRSWRDYVRRHSLNPVALLGFAGASGVVEIIDCGNGRFDFGKGHEDAFPAFVIEAFDRDGETACDLVAWPLERPEHVLSMFGRCGLLGAWQAFGAAHYVLDRPLLIHRTPLDWLKSDCSGAAVVTPALAARLLLDVPGQVAAADIQHGRKLKALIESVIPKHRVVVPVSGRVAA